MRKAYSYIRMSTDIQLKGDSKRRQLEASAAYAAENGLELVESIDGEKLQDIGVSGFKGKNALSGVLGRFIEALKNGRIERGSVLLIEDLDRLSRTRLTKALTQFMELLDLGIEIVTVVNKQRYTKDILDVNPGALFICIGTMYRANDESERKSTRIQEAWNTKRKNASSSPMTAMGPGWLRLSKETKKFEVIPERVAVVQKIFSMCADTCGLYGITQYLNESGTPPFGRSKLWHRSYVHKILTSRSVLGEFQPHKNIDGKPSPIGEIIPDYYPRIILNEGFHLAAAAIDRRNIGNRGRKGAQFSNIFSGLVFCGSCGAKMALRNRGEPPKGGRYLVCSRQLAHAGCKMPEWRLDEFQQTILKHLREIDFSKLLTEQNSPLTDIRNSIADSEHKLLAKEKLFDRQADFINSEDLLPMARNKIVLSLNETTLEIESIKKELAAKHQQYDEHIESEKLLSSSLIQDLITQVDDKADDYLFRSAVNQILSKSIIRIDAVQESFTFIPSDYDEEDDEVRIYRSSSKKREKISLDELVNRASFCDFCKSYNRRLMILYRNGSIRHVQYKSGRSMVFKKSFDKTPLPSMRTMIPSPSSKTRKSSNSKVDKTVPSA